MMTGRNAVGKDGLQKAQDLKMTETHAGSHHSPAALKLVGVRKAFGPTEIIRGVDWMIPRGEGHVLIGPNGAGRSGLGRSFQTANLFGRMSTFENARIGGLRAVGYGPSFLRTLPRGGPADIRALEVLDEVGLLDKRNEPAALLSYADQRAL